MDTEVFHTTDFTIDEIIKIIKYDLAGIYLIQSSFMYYVLPSAIIYIIIMYKN